MVSLSLVLLVACYNVFQKDPSENKDFLTGNTDVYNVAQLDNSKKNEEIKFGHRIFNNSPKYLGPDEEHPKRTFSGNGLSCNNCHLLSGTKPFAAPLIGITKRFPQFRGRENKMGTIEERINGCMERSMNGRTMPSKGKEMKALIAYLEWLGRNAPEDGKIDGQGFVKIRIPNRPVDLDSGKSVFKKYCVVCHGDNGQGQKSKDGQTYTYPPLWGEDSYNNGAGMTRVITAAQFIKANMPFGTTYKNPVLTDEEAYDVAGFINQQARPEKSNLNLDFPDLKKKPVSTPYPPYVDTFSIEQHRVGPFQPIMEYYRKTHSIEKTK
ncbi:c-type cytochrome [Pareuzebyella sediminis]|uniref:c-type cytochrome n=1 Tax=Pareuzebyella sediminis TaxID=2607998 RepID=UPI0011EE93F5|nr:c-type cytochrome [Pareuzebyella sediminis]